MSHDLPKNPVPKPRVLQVVSGMGGCAFWRMLWAGHLLNMKGAFEIFFSDQCSRNILDYARMNAIHLQRKGLDDPIALYEKIARLRDRFKLRLLYDTDDILFFEDIPDYNLCKDRMRPFVGEFDNIRKTIELCDEVTVSTYALREYILEKTSQKKVSVIQNFPPAYLFGHLYDEEHLIGNFHKYRKKPRILFAGSSTHFETKIQKEEIVDDFFPIKEEVLSTITEFHWIFVGGIPLILKPLVEKGLIEYHHWIPLSDYPRFLASLNVNMAIAPLLDNRFNRCKSDLKFLEASTLGLPIACQDIPTFAIAPIRFRTGKEMLEKIRATLSSEETYIEASRDGRRRVEARWLENQENYGKYLDLYSYPYESFHRKYLK